MKDYNEMAKSVFKKRDEYLIAQKKRRAMLLKAGVPLCSLVLVTMLSLIVWQAKLPKMPKKPLEPTINITEQVKPDDTSKGVVNSPNGEFTETQHSSVQALQSVEQSAGGSQNIPNPTQNTQEYTGDRPQSQGGKPVTDPIYPQPNTGGVFYPNSSEAGGKPPTIIQGGTKPMEEMTLPSLVPGGDDPTWVPVVPATGTDNGDALVPPCSPVNPTLPADCTVGESDYPEPTAGNEVCVTTSPTEPMPTGPLEITVEDEVIVAQVGDKVTYTVELMAPKKFENIQIALNYNSNYLNLLVPAGVYEGVCSDTTPNLTDATVGFNYNVFKVVASDIVTKYDFRQRKVLFSVEFIVKKPGKLEWDFTVEEMCIYVGSSPSEHIKYFSRGEQLTFDGITFYHNLSVNE